MNGTSLISNRWVVGVALLLYGALLWGGFQWIYRAEIELQRLAHATETPNPERTGRVYEAIMRSPVKRTNLETFVALGDLLERTERWNEAILVWRHTVAVAPENHGFRWRLALALHNAGRYTEAERYFAELLGEEAT
ncbi:MAG: hypothetical protein C3F12_05545 [Candidatus Methylomirabilota bacterium]|nr:tetratricopeptide repeat protein [Candidatus Methylomirabilis sp.]NJD67909.1 tetratricopeptide repeat protein [candidate division NC10 bacterium]PWB47433.1 MAG: hypothetical protein C3F12_05545 [candidate division NC10 bacterium]